VEGSGSGEAMASVTLVVDLPRPLGRALLAANLMLEHGIEAAPTTEAVDMREEVDPT